MTARPTVYKGIRMRSRLEARFAASLEQLWRQWDYEPECFADNNGQYLPDFMVQCSNERVYIEVKPTAELATAALHGPMSIIHSSDPHAVLWAVWPEKLDAGAYGNNAYEWRVIGREHHWVPGVEGVTASLSRAGTLGDVYEVGDVTVVTADQHGPYPAHIVTPVPADVGATVRAVHAFHGKRVWVLFASGAAGAHMPLGEYDTSGSETDHYSGHFFTMSDSDHYMASLAVQQYLV